MPQVNTVSLRSISYLWEYQVIKFELFGFMSRWETPEDMF